jgi:hypothetical protein
MYLIILYIIWILLPLMFFSLALWSKLEQISGKPKRDHVGDLVTQGFFVLICVIISFGIDYYFLPSLYAFIAIPWIPLGFYQVLLLPVVLFIAGKITGPSMDIRITKAPRPTLPRKEK